MTSRTALVTGATGKLGRSISQYLLNHDWRVVLASRSLERAQSLADELQAKNSAIPLELNLRDHAQIDDKLTVLANEGVCITHLVNNARSLDTLAVSQNGYTDAVHFLGEFELGVVSAYVLTTRLLSMTAHNLKAVVNIGSQYGIVGPSPDLLDNDFTKSPIQYGVTKAALHHMTRELAVRLAPDVRVNAIAFGGFQGRADATFVEKYASILPAARMLQDPEAGAPVEFLLDDEKSSAITGHVMVADGGWTII